MWADHARKIFVIAAALAPVSLACAANPPATFLPAAGLAKFIVAEWDVRTMSSSLNPRRTTQQSHFSDVGLSVSEATDDRVVLDGADDTFVIQVLKRGDANNDGIEDVVVCLSESAKVGTLRSSHAFVLQKYSKTTPLVALAYTVRDNQCL